jgi:uncharacterized protein (TIGR03437 family)
MSSPLQHIRVLLITVLLFSLASATLGQGTLQWRPLAPIQGGSVLALLSAGGRVYAGTRYRGVFISTDNGTTWRQASNGLGDIAVYALAAVGSNVLAATADGIFRTTDGGQSWVRVAAGGQTVRSLLLDGTNLYAGTATGSVLRSTNEGQTWNSRGNIPDQRRVQALAIFGGQLYAGTSRGVFYFNEGQGWMLSGSGLPISGTPNVQALAVADGQLFAGITGVFDLGAVAPQIHSSRDGRDWAAVGDTLSVPLAPLVSGVASVRGFFFDESGMYAVTTAGVFLFTGQLWVEYINNRGLPYFGEGLGVMIRSNGRLLLGGDGGVYTSASDGQGWIPSRTGLTATEIFALAVRGNTIFASAGASGFFRSQDEGRSWTAINVTNNPRPFSPFHFAVKGNSIFAGGSGFTFRSDNDGQSWTEIGGFETWGTIISLAATEQDVYVNSDGAVYKLNSEGTAWVLPPDAPFLGRIGVAGLAVSGAYIYGLSYYGMQRSTSGGSNFMPLNLSPEFFGGTAIAARGSNVYVAHTPLDGIPRLLVSTNYGESFTTSQANLQAYQFAFVGNTIYAAGSGGVHFSNDNGLNWTAANAGLPAGRVLRIAAKGDTLLAGTIGYGVYTTSRATPTALATVSAASLRPSTGLAPESIATAFGTALATATQVAATQPLPTLLAGTRVVVRDSAGVERDAPLFFVSPTQINYQVPQGTAPGNATVTATSGDGSVAVGSVTISAVAPGLFSANASGQGLTAAIALRIKADGSQSFEPVIEFNTTGQLIARPIDLGPATDQVFVIIYGTGVRLRSSLTAVTAQIGGVNAEVTFAGAQGNFTGLDQVNLRLPRSLAGRGEVEIALTADGKAANTVRVAVR